jgi:hypothetical protein
MLMRHPDGREIVTANDEVSQAAARASGFEPVDDEPEAVPKPKRKAR